MSQPWNIYLSLDKLDPMQIHSFAYKDLCDLEEAGNINFFNQYNLGSPEKNEPIRRFRARRAEKRYTRGPLGALAMRGIMIMRSGPLAQSD